jgi:hypothetical protein
VSVLPMDITLQQADLMQHQDCAGISIAQHCCTCCTARTQCTKSSGTRHAQGWSRTPPAWHLVHTRVLWSLATAGATPEVDSMLVCPSCVGMLLPTALPLRVQTLGQASQSLWDASSTRALQSVCNSCFFVATPGSPHVPMQSQQTTQASNDLTAYEPGNPKNTCNT